MSDTLIRQVRELKQRAATARIIHYSCESFYDVTDRPVAIACIAIVDLATTNEHVFAITGYKSDDESEREKALLDDFYRHLRNTPDAIYVHWNMHHATFSFEAIAQRYKYLTDKDAPYQIAREQRYDLDSFISHTYGGAYANDPKLMSMSVLNDFNKRFALSGAVEADKFKNREFGDMVRSTTEKAQLIAFLTKRFLEGTLKTNSSKVSFADENLDAYKVVLEIGQKFFKVRNQLRTRRKPKEPLLIEDEFDFQYLFEALLRLFFDDIRAEEWTSEFAGSSKRLDFLIPKHNLAVELKHSRPSMTATSLGDELKIDLPHYKQLSGIRTVVWLVFDREGHITNPAGIEADMTATHDGINFVTKILT